MSDFLNYHKVAYSRRCHSCGQLKLGGIVTRINVVSASRIRRPLTIVSVGVFDSDVPPWVWQCSLHSIALHDSNWECTIIRSTGSCEYIGGPLLKTSPNTQANRERHRENTDRQIHKPTETGTATGTVSVGLGSGLGGGRSEGGGSAGLGRGGPHLHLGCGPPTAFVSSSAPSCVGVIFGVILEYLGFLGLGGSLRRFVLFPQPDFGEMRAEYCFFIQFWGSPKITQKLLKNYSRLQKLFKNYSKHYSKHYSAARVCGGRYKINYSGGGGVRRTIQNQLLGWGAQNLDYSRIVFPSNPALTKYSVIVFLGSLTVTNSSGIVCPRSPLDCQLLRLCIHSWLTCRSQSHSVPFSLIH